MRCTEQMCIGKKRRLPRYTKEMIEMAVWQGLFISMALFALGLYVTLWSWCDVRRVYDNFDDPTGKHYIQIAWENNRLNWAQFSISIAVTFIWAVFLIHMAWLAV